MKRPTCAPGDIDAGVALSGPSGALEAASSAPGTAGALRPTASVDSSCRHDPQLSRCTWASRLRASASVPSRSCWKVLSVRQSKRSSRVSRGFEVPPYAQVDLAECEIHETDSRRMLASDLGQHGLEDPHGLGGPEHASAREIQIRG